MVVIGSMIGSGIFLVSADMGRMIGSPGWLLAAWVLTGALTIAGALSYGELAAMMPRAGGQYVYLRESYSPLWGFLYGWTLFTIIQTGTIAAVSVAFARFAGVFFPGGTFAGMHWRGLSETTYLIAPIHFRARIRGLALDRAARCAVLLICRPDVDEYSAASTTASSSRTSSRRRRPARCSASSSWGSCGAETPPRCRANFGNFLDASQTSRRSCPA